ncbi:hypothetical protein GuangZ0019_2190 [Mycobacterium tuberculosis GuangZ0019]|nr:predicted protein [Mycobacterium tuberculosis GM 1503]EFI32077.1 predicted protein [Mycobacterium tuberculosis 94_M4241A]EQM16742.1 hypothetical protein FJ05194_4112 [Mycobacterium tuberculosis FJ05194]EQM20521.1 hypothetical protein GuangZ0019_2190 [Mycobacterium tuberculosis GuangZ0019]
MIPTQLHQFSRVVMLSADGLELVRVVRVDLTRSCVRRRRGSSERGIDNQRRQQGGSGCDHAGAGRGRR